jgi:hypothetical protein
MSSSEPALPAPPAAAVEHDSASETAAIPAQPPSPGPVSDAASSGTAGTELEGEALMEALRRQVEFYFSKSNLQSDSFLVSLLTSLFPIAYVLHM